VTASCSCCCSSAAPRCSRTWWPHRRGAAARRRGADRVAVSCRSPAVRRGVRLQRGCVVAQHGGRAEPPAVLADLRDHRREHSRSTSCADGQRGREPFKIAASRPGWPAPCSGSVVLYQMLHTLGMLLSFLTRWSSEPCCCRPTGDSRGLAIAFLALAALIFLLLTGHGGGTRAPVGLLHRLPLARSGGASRSSPKRGHHHPNGRADHRVLSPRPRRFVEAVVLEYLSRSIFMLEYVLIAMVWA